MEFRMQQNGFVANFNYGPLDISGDEQYGFRPYQLLVSSVAICSGGVLRKILDKMRYDYDDITIKAKVERVEFEANRVSKIELCFFIRTPEWNQQKIEKALRLTRKNCSMIQSVQSSIKVVENAEWIKS